MTWLDVDAVIELSRKKGCDWTLAEFKVLVNLAQRRNGDTGRLDPSLKRLADDCHMDRKNVRQVLGRLEEKKAIRRHGDSKGGVGRRRPIELVCLERGVSDPPLPDGERGVSHPPNLEENLEENREADPLLIVGKYLKVVGRPPVLESRLQQHDDEQRPATRARSAPTSRLSPEAGRRDLRAPPSAATPSAPRTWPRRRGSTVPPWLRSSASSTSGPGSARCRQARTNHRHGWPPPLPPPRLSASGGRRLSHDHRRVRRVRAAQAARPARPGRRPPPEHRRVPPCCPHGRRRPGPPPLPRVRASTAEGRAVTEPRRLIHPEAPVEELAAVVRTALPEHGSLFESYQQQP